MECLLSVIILTKNEALNIQDCINSVKDLADEILVIDGNSNDATAMLAKQAGALVYNLKTWHGWGDKRRQAQHLAHGHWLLHLDADERLTPDGIKEIKSVLAKAQDNEIISIPRANHLFGHRIRHCGWYPDYVVRLYANAYTSYNEAMVHEHVIEPQGCRKVYLQHPIIHYTYRNFDQCLNKQRNYALAFGDEKSAKGRRCSLLSIPLRGMFSFIRVYFLRQGFRDGRYGLWLALSTAVYTMNKYLALSLPQSERR